MTQRRRLDRILADDYLSALGDRSTDDIRRLRDECEEEEAGISFARRCLQGKLDIVRAEALRRRDGGQGNGEASGLLDALPSILGDEHVSRPLRPRVTRFLVPPSVQYHRREIERLASEQTLSGLMSRPVEELTELVEEMAAKERELSALRRQLFDRIDALQDELASRYKHGHADVAEVLTNRG